MSKDEWVATTVQEFLDLSDEDMEIIERRLAMRHNKRRRGRSKAPKDESMRKHAKRKAWERWEINVTNEMYDDVVADIMGRRDQVVFRQTNSRKWYVVMLDGRMVVAVFNKHKHLIHTFLPMQFLNEKRSILFQPYTERQEQLEGWAGRTVTLHEPPITTVRGRLSIDANLYSVGTTTFINTDIEFIFQYRPDRLYIELKSRETGNENN